MNSQKLAAAIEEFLSSSSSAVLIEDGAVAFDLAQSKYSISGESNKCLIHFWSAERNMVRRVLEIERKGEALRMTVQRMGQSRPTRLELSRDRDQRAASVKRRVRMTYRHTLERVLRRHFPDFTIAQMSTSMDLEKSFGPIYARGLIKRGQSAFAVLGVNAQELQSSIDAALTFGILWLDGCRQAHAADFVVEGLKLFLPVDTSAIARERMAQLDVTAAKWHLHELDERCDEIKNVEVADRGNISTRLVRCADRSDVLERFSAPVSLISALMPEVEVCVITSAEVSFRCHGLEFARARLAGKPGEFRSEPEIVFGTGGCERVLNGSNFAQLERLICEICEARHADGPSDSRWWRLHPERWLESLVVKNVRALDDSLDATYCYSQVPAFSASDRAMIDVLTRTRDGRLAVLELKADEDIHLPMQGLDYWSRAAWHHARGEFQRFGYFAGLDLSSQAPLLLMIAPAFHIHPATDTLLRYVSPAIDWTVLGIDERWRKELRVIFRKRPDKSRLKVAV